MADDTDTQDFQDNTMTNESKINIKTEIEWENLTDEEKDLIRNNNPNSDDK